MTHADSDQPLRHTPLLGLHESLGARMVPFAGYTMPLQYPTGIITEHTHTRSHAGLFDVSHMGQIRISGPRAATALETLMPIDVVDLPPGRQRYGLLTNDDGGILDDLMVANLGKSLLVVVNAACKSQDLALLEQRIGDHCEIALLDDRALIALQGPDAATVIGRLSTRAAEMKFMEVIETELHGARCYVSRSGYTGEDGFEISLPAEAAESFARTLLAHPSVAPVGLGARDTLRLEAGLCLYGQDIDATTTPVEASLQWALSRARRRDGARPAGFPGADVILRQLETGAARARVGLLPSARTPVRGGCTLVDAEDRAVGVVTSGSFGPTLGAPVAMGYVAADALAAGAALAAVVRNTRIHIEATRSPPVAHRYVRAAPTRRDEPSQ